jgi:glutamate-1-semialdehyde 2,1-aminomutase
MATVTSSAAAVLDRERQEFERRTPRSRDRFQRAVQAFPGGDTRAATFHPPYPIALDRAERIDLVDLDGNHYLDFLQNYTSLVLGHRHPAVMAAVAEMLGRLTSAAAAVPAQLELAEEIIRRVESVELLRFTNSGSESTLVAVWAARAFTGRTTVIKAIGGYHGCVPELDRSIRPGAFPAGLPASAPVLAVPFNDAEALRGAVEGAGETLAAVILEPVLGSGGVVPPEAGYLELARSLTREADALLVFDEVITFRLAPGGYQQLANIEPDLTAFAKIIGGGFPVGAVGGRADVMEVFQPGTPRSVMHSGTYNGNPITAAAGLQTLELLDATAYERLDRLGAMLASGLEAAIEQSGVGAQVTHVGSLANVHFTTVPVRDFDSAQRSDAVAAAAYHLGLLNRGVFIAPRGMMAVAAVADEADVQTVIDGSADLFAALAE